jgi:hypothetical protein
MTMKTTTMARGTDGLVSRVRRVGAGCVAAALAAIFLTVARPAAAVESPDYANDFGVGVGTVLCNLVYMPVKVVYATVGGITGGFAYILTAGRMDTASSIWRPSMGGTYVITPSMLRGEDPIYFSGTADDDSDHRAERRTSDEPPVGDRGRPGESY